MTAGRDYAVPGETDRTKHIATQRLKKMAAADLQRLRVLEEAFASGLVQCVTCPTIHPFNSVEMLGGHFISRQFSGALFVEDNIWPQCAGCNWGKRGNISEYERFLTATLGLERVLELKRLPREPSKLHRYQIVEMRRSYAARTKEQRRRLA